MTAKNMPAAEAKIDEPLVRAVLEEQHGDLARLPLRELGTGWDNVIFRLGDELTVRLPRREAAVSLMFHEQRWLPEIAPHLPLPTPVPVRIGRPSSRFAWPWTIASWLPGEVAALTAPTDLKAAAGVLAGFVSSMHQDAPHDAPLNPYRGVPLNDRDEATRERLESLGSMVDRDAASAAWDDALRVRGFEGPPVWLHGDLHPANVLVREGRISAVIDFGDITAGDPATDLSVAWMLFGPAEREVFRTQAGRGGCPIDDATWARSRGWALSLALAYLESSANNPVMAAFGRETISAVLADQEL